MSTPRSMGSPKLFLFPATTLYNVLSKTKQKSPPVQGAKLQFAWRNSNMVLQVLTMSQTQFFVALLFLFQPEPILRKKDDSDVANGRALRCSFIIELVYVYM